MDAFDLLDHNCWRFVFRKLDAVEHTSCRLVCSQFYNLLEEKPFKEKRKFHEVLPNLIPYLSSRNGQDRINWTDLQKLRLVCQSWRQSVEKYASQVYQPPSSFYRDFLPLATLFFKQEEFAEFHQRFGGYQTNPFPSRTVYITNWYHQIRYPGAFIQKLTNFVERFGRDIFTLKMLFRLDKMGHFFLLKLLKSILIHLPNIRNLFVLGEYEGVGPRVRDDPQEMANWIGENELPDLPKLKGLEMDGVDETVKNYLVEKYGPQLTYFRRTFDDKNCQELPIQLNPQLFPNLRKISLDIRDYKDTLEPLRFLQSLKVLKLFLNFPRQHGQVQHWKVDKVLRNLKDLPLTCLKIRAGQYRPVYMAEGDLELGEYINKSIQTVSIHFNCKMKVSFNFLEALTKLEVLKVKFQAGYGAITHPEDLDEEVQLNDYLRVGGECPYQSNIWGKVPSLKTLMMKRKLMPLWQNGVERSTYTREV